MTGFNHGMTGAIIALTIKHPALAVPLSYASHFLQDAIPHHDYLTGGKKEGLFTRKFNQLLVLDFLFSVCLMVFLAIIFPAQKWIIWGCMVAAASPDLMWGYYKLYLERIKRKTAKYGPLARLHHMAEWSETPKGAFVELAWFVTMAAIIWNIYLKL